MVVACDKWLGRHEKICVRFMKIYGQSNKISVIPAEPKNL